MDNELKVYDVCDDYSLELSDKTVSEVKGKANYRWTRQGRQGDYLPPLELGSLIVSKSEPFDDELHYAIGPDGLTRKQVR